MSDARGMVTTLMETNQTTDNSEPTASTSVPRYAELQQLIAGMATDFEKFYKDNNKAAGTRVRNAMQELKTLAQTIRTEVQSIKNSAAGGEKNGSSESTDSED
jgi:ABC-type transporter Mla subunit MlaD